jgi:NhaP-type Na+/H+ or K+/H+ antiporter
MQSVILAGPGVLIGAALMGSMTKGILPYNWNWNLAMTFGSILSATGKFILLLRKKVN